MEPIGLLKNRKFARVTNSNETKILKSVLLLKLILRESDMFLPFAKAYGKKSCLKIGIKLAILWFYCDKSILGIFLLVGMNCCYLV